MIFSQKNQDSREFYWFALLLNLLLRYLPSVWINIFSIFPIITWCRKLKPGKVSVNDLPKRKWAPISFFTRMFSSNLISVSEKLCYLFCHPVPPLYFLYYPPEWVGVDVISSRGQKTRRPANFNEFSDFQNREETLESSNCEEKMSEKGKKKLNQNSKLPISKFYQQKVFSEKDFHIRHFLRQLWKGKTRWKNRAWNFNGALG